MPFVGAASCNASVVACSVTCFGAPLALHWSTPAAFALPSGGAVCPSAACAACVAAVYTACLAPAVGWPRAAAASTRPHAALARLQRACQTLSGQPTPALPGQLVAPFTFAQLGNATSPLAPFASRSCASIAAQLATQCALTLIAYNTSAPFANVSLAVPPVCSPDCAALFVDSGFASACMWAAVAPNLATDALTALSAYAARCAQWSTCSAHAQPLAFSNMVCAAVNTKPCGPHQVSTGRFVFERNI